MRVVVIPVRKSLLGLLQSIAHRGHAGPGRPEASSLSSDKPPVCLRGHILPIGGEPIRQELPRATFAEFAARLGKSCQNVPAHFDDFPLKAWRAVEL